MSLDERLAALREDDDTMNNTPPMSRRSSFLGSLSRRSRTSSIASDPGLSRRSSESIAPTLTRQRSATESELLPGRRHLIEVKHEWVPSEKWLPSIGVSVADRRLAIAFERRRSSSGRSRTTVSLDGRLALLLLFLTLIPAATGLAVLGGARPAAAATRAAVASRAPAPNFFLNDAPRPLVDGLRRAHDASIEEQFQQDFAAELPTYPPPAASVAALDDATRYLPEEERRAVDSALDYAARAHEGQRRKSGEAYVTHPIAVAVLLAEQRMDVDTIVAGLLHDTVEDTELTLDDISFHFGPEVMEIVRGDSKMSKLCGEAAALPADERKELNHRNMLLAMGDDWRIVVVKLADRLHNMRTLEHMPRHKQVAIARETLQIFVPLARRLGIETLERELTDISVEYIFPEELKGVFGLELLGHWARIRFWGALDGLLLRDTVLSELDVDSKLDDHRERWAEHADYWAVAFSK